MDTKYNKYLEQIRSQSKEMAKTLLRWSNQNSFTDNVEGLARMAELLRSDFALLGGTEKMIAVPSRTKIDDQGKLSKCPQGQALQITKRPKAPIQILLAGHMDTVFPPESPFQQAKIVGPRIRGPGAADMKGGLVVMLKALQALEDSPWSEKVGWEVLITPDEEAGSCGSEKLYEKAAKKHRIGLLFEPSFSDGALVSSRKGSKNISVAVKGKSAHAGRDFHQGRNAISALIRWLLNVEQLSDPTKGITVNIGQIEGGGAFNIVPDFASAKVNIRTDTAEDDAVIDECLQFFTDEANDQKDIVLIQHCLARRLPKAIDDNTTQLFSLLRECGKDLGADLQWRPSGGVCDGNILASCGLPTLDTLGVIGGGLHTSDEYIETSSLTERACLTALFLLKVASEEISLPGNRRAT